MNDVKSLSHSKWRCKYHIVFAPKYRRQVIYNKIKVDIGKILYGNRHFWCRGYYVDTVGKYENAIKNYIKNQLQEDIMADQLSLKEFVDPFTGSRSEKGK